VGAAWPGPAAQREILPQMALQMIRVGEESGSLDSMLAKVAEVYDKETQASVRRLLTLLEPILIIGLGAPGRRDHHLHHRAHPGRSTRW
jgi:general secretion pathway protein F